MTAGFNPLNRGNAMGTFDLPWADGRGLSRFNPLNRGNAMGTTTNGQLRNVAEVVSIL